MGRKRVPELMRGYGLDFGMRPLALQPASHPRVARPNHVCALDRLRVDDRRSRLRSSSLGLAQPLMHAVVKRVK
jgi:hypothetical protein